MCDEEQALVRAICTTPFDDLPRMVYADWLEERGEVERAEFIRVQCATPAEWSVNREHELLEYFAAEDMAQRFGLRPHETLYTVDSGYTVPGAGVELRFSRGFVHKVECTLAQFMGGPCACRITNSGRVVEPSASYGTPHCPDCKGTGRRPGLVDTIFRVQPVTEVVITDLRPWNPEPRSGHSWWTEDSAGEIFNDRVPHDLYELLDGYEYADSNYKRYPTNEAAIAALARACVAIGRKRAGLKSIEF